MILLAVFLTQPYSEGMWGLPWCDTVAGQASNGRCLDPRGRGAPEDTRFVCEKDKSEDGVRDCYPEVEPRKETT
jgi:hypothetical protein